MFDNPRVRRPTQPSGHVSGSWIMAQADVTFQFEIINLELISFLYPIISVIWKRIAQYASLYEFALQHRQKYFAVTLGADNR